MRELTRFPVSFRNFEAIEASSAISDPLCGVPRKQMPIVSKSRTLSLSTADSEEMQRAFLVTRPPCTPELAYHMDYPDIGNFYRPAT